MQNRAMNKVNGQDFTLIQFHLTCPRILLLGICSIKNMREDGLVTELQFSLWDLLLQYLVSEGLLSA